MNTIKPKVSVVTVCYNAAEEIQITIESVLSQSSHDYEYIIIDGMSTDGTCEVVESYESKFANKNISFHYMSGPDRGIYDAMNKSLNYCSGEWVIFMNAGDYFYSEKIISDLLIENYGDSISVLYGGVVKFDLASDLEIKEMPNDIERILKHMPFCHQSSFVRLQDIKSRGFDLDFKIAADYDFFLDLYLQGKGFLKLDFFVSYFELGGVSSRNEVALYDDFLSVKHKYNLVNKNSIFARAKRQFFILKNSLFLKSR
ncbi:glycosyltransferase family 2 protein [Aeromonas veronii]